nr:hypothetical protein [Russula sp.]
MSHQDIIIILATLGFASTFGVYVAIRKIKHYTSSPVNTLHRRGDLELQEVIDPIQHINVRDIDLSSLPQYPQAMVNHIPIRWDVYVPPRFSHLTENTATGNTPPGYSQLTNNFINCPLENNINLDFVWLILFFTSILIITLLIRKYGKLLLILILIFVIHLESVYSISLLIPFSFFEIDFRDSFEWKFNSYGDKYKISYLQLQTLSQDIIKLLDSLKDDVNYSMSLSFISSYKEWKDNKEKVHPLFIDNAIIINKESDPILITQFIMNRLDNKNLFITNWLFKDSSINKMDPVILTVTVPIKVKI